MAHFRRMSEIQKLRQDSLKRGLNILPGDARTLLKNSERFDKAASAVTRKAREKNAADKAEKSFEEHVVAIEQPPVQAAPSAPTIAAPPPMPESLVTIDEAVLLKVGTYWRAPSLRMLIDGEKLRALVRIIGVKDLSAARRHEGPSENARSATPDGLDAEGLINEGKKCQNTYLTGLSQTLRLSEAQRRAALIKQILMRDAV